MAPDAPERAEVLAALSDRDGAFASLFRALEGRDVRHLVPEHAAPAVRPGRERRGRRERDDAREGHAGQPLAVQGRGDASGGRVAPRRAE